MFDNIGKNPDEEANKRSLQSLLITVGVLGTVIGASIFAAVRTVQEIVADDTEVEMVEVMIDEISEDLSPPPPPPPPPGPAEEEEEEEEEEEDEPDELNEEIQELEEEVKEEIKEQEKPKGEAGGEEGGVEGGVVGGVVGGVEGGVLGGTGTGVRRFHHSELEVKRRKNPIYPDAAKALNLGDQRCKVRVLIDESGVPYEVRVEGCPQAFHTATKEAILSWRWYPPRDGRAKVKAATTIGVTYKLK